MKYLIHTRHKARVSMPLSWFNLSIVLISLFTMSLTPETISQANYLKFFDETCDHFNYYIDYIHIVRPATGPDPNPNNGVPETLIPERNEKIFLLDDGRIEHRVDGGITYIDNAIIFMDWSDNNVAKHATFSSGLWMIRSYSVTEQKPIGAILAIQPNLTYIEAGWIQERIWGIQNCVFRDKNSSFNFTIFGLPLQSYNFSDGWRADDDGKFGGSIYRIEESSSFWEYLSLPDQFWNTNHVDTRDYGGPDFPNHVLPAETNKFFFTTDDRSLFGQSCSDPDALSFYKLYVHEDPGFYVWDDFNTPHVFPTIAEGGMYQFDITSLNLNQEGGQKFFTIEYTGFDAYQITIPVMLERPTEGLSPFVDSDGVTKSVISGPVEIDMVLHDPPGDNSSATYTTGTTICTTSELSFGSGNNSAFDNRIQVGFSGSAGGGVSANIETTVGFSIDVAKESMSLSTNSIENCMILTQDISTAGNLAFGEGDRFLGTSSDYHMYYGRRMFWNEGNGTFLDTMGLYLEIIEQHAFDKSEKQIKDEIIQLQADLASLTQGAEDAITFAYNKNILVQSIEILYDILTENQGIRVDPDILPIPPANITSISAGPKTVTEELQQTSTRTTSYEIITEKRIGVDQTILIAGNGYVGSQSWGSTKTKSGSHSRSSGSTTTNSFTLEDVNASRTDGIELTNVTQHIDPRFGNSFFRVTPDSRTSCPYEGGKRTEQPSVKSRILPINPNESNHIYITGAPAGQVLVVPIDLCNLFFLNDQLKTGNFILEYESGTGGGAQVEIQQNVPLQNQDYSYDYDSCFGDEGGQQLQSIRITQATAGSVCYDDKNNTSIRLLLRTECNDGASDVLDVLNISVCFTTDPDEALNMNAECEVLSNIDHALNFDGVDDHVEVYAQAQPFTFNDFSYEFWVKPDKQVNLQSESSGIGVQSSASMSGGSPFAIFPTNGLDVFALTDTIVGSVGQVNIGIAVGTNGVQVIEHYDGFYEGNDITHSPVVLNHPTTINDWTHIAVVYKKRLPTLYINGVQAKVGLRSEFLGVHPGLQLGGGIINGKENFFGGTLDELRVYSYARSAAQILDNKNNRSTGAEAEMMLIFRFDSQMPGAANAGANSPDGSFAGLNDLSGTLDPENAVLRNFDYGETSSNWVTGRVAEMCNPCVQAADICQDAIPITVSAAPCINPVNAGISSCASDSGGTPPSCGIPNNLSNGTWYSFVVPPSGQLLIETSDDGSGAFDTAMSLYSGSCGNLTQISCNDDFAGTLFSQIGITGATPGITLYLKIWEYNNDNTGTFNVCVSDPTNTCPGSVDADADALSDCVDLCPNERDVALDFTGGNADPSGDYIEVPHHPDLNIVDGDFAIEAWIYSTGTGHRTIVSKGNGFDPTTTPYVFGIWDEAVATVGGRLGLYLSGDWQWGNTVIPQNVWTHVAVSFDWATKTAIFYYNGVVDGQTPFNPANTAFNNADTNPMFISRQGFANNWHNFTGKIDEIAIWDKALTSAGIAGSMGAPYAGNEGGLVAYYDFNDADACLANAANTSLIDKANSHNGTLLNFGLAFGCQSNWTSGHNIGACVPDACPPNLDLTSNQNSNADYESGGYISSDQTINSPAQVDYDATTEISLLEGFEVKAGALFHAFIDGCGNALRHISEAQK